MRTSSLPPSNQLLSLASSVASNRKAAGSRADEAGNANVSRQTAATMVNLSALAKLSLAANNQAAANKAAEKEAAGKEKDKAKEGGVSGMLGETMQRMKEQKKMDALERLAAVKKQLELMRLTGGDPKIAAKLAKELSKELRAAAKDYAEASKDGGAASAEPAEAAGAPAADGEATTGVPAKDAHGMKPEGADGAATKSTAAKETEDRVKFDESVLDEFKNTAKQVAQALKAAVEKLKTKKADEAQAKDGQKELETLNKEMAALSVRGEPTDVGAAKGAALDILA